MDDLERIPVGVEYIGGIVSRIVFQSCAGRNVVPGTSGHCGLVEFIDLVFIFGHETPVNGCWIRLPLLYPEERLLAVAKSPQIGMTVFALVRHEEFDIKRLQGGLIKRQRPLDIADSENNVVEHRLPSKHECFNGLFAVGYSMDRKRRYVHASALTAWTSSIPIFGAAAPPPPPPRALGNSSIQRVVIVEHAPR